MTVPVTCCLWTFPISRLDPDLMEILGYTATETLLWDYSFSEAYYVLAKPPARRVKTLYQVTPVYAWQWFRLNGSNNLRIVYYPFSQVHFRNAANPCDCPPERVTITASISVEPSSVPEDAGVPMIYTVTLDDTSLYVTTIDFVLTGTAVEGVDYVAVTPTVTIAIGSTTGSFSILPIEDSLTEGDETVIATLAGGSSGVNTIIASGSATGTIIDVPPVSEVTWDPDSVDNVVLSNANLTNTNTGVFDDNGDPQGAVVTGFASSGKYYFEVSYATQGLSFNGMGFGIGSAGGNYSGFNYAGGAYGVVLYGNNFAADVDTDYRGNVLTGPATDADGDVFGVAVNLDSGNVWFQVVDGPDVDPTNGWNGVNGDPVAGTGGFAIPPGLKTIFGTYADSDSSQALTLNLGASPFSGTAPTGYTAGWPSAGFTPIVTGAPWGTLTTTNVTLSNSDLTATNDLDGPPASFGGVLGTVDPIGSVRKYFEVTCTEPGAYAFNTYFFGAGSSVQVGSGFGVDRAGILKANFSNTGDSLNLSAPGFQAGDVVGFAFDFIANTAWCGIVAGPSYPGFNPWAGQVASSYPPTFPATNTWGAALAGGPFKPLIAFGSTDNTQAVTYNLTGPFVGTPSVKWLGPYSVWAGTAVLSNGNLTVTSTNGNAVYVISSGGHAVASPSSGSWWFEITLGATYAGTGTACGIGNAFFAGGYAFNPGSQGYFSFQVDVLGRFWFNNTGFAGSGATAVTLGATAPGDVLQFAVKIGTTSQIWVRINRGGVPQNWNGDPTASPFPASGGFDITALFNNSDVYYAPSVMQGFNSSGSSSTVNFGQTTFVTNPPIFPAWANTFDPWTGALDPAQAILTTLSNADLTATNNYPAASVQGVTVATASGKTSGKYYFEITVTIDKDGDAMMGVAPVGTDYLQFALDAVGGVGCYAGGGIYSNGTYTGLSVSLGQVDRVGVAVDLDNRMIWFITVDGSDYYQPDSWNGLSIGDADPATNLNGIPLVAGTIVPIAAFSARAGDDAGNALTINTGQTPFAALVPVGFTAGWPA